MHPATPVLIVASVLKLLAASPLYAQCNNPPACRTPATTPTPVTLSDCSQLSNPSFVAGRRYRVTASNCAITVIRINQPNVIFEGYPSSVTFMPANANTDAIEILADGVALQNITLSPNGTTRFQDGIRVAHHVHNASIQNVDMNGATRNAGIIVSSTGTGTCVRDTTVSNAGTGDANSNGYLVRLPPAPTPGGGTIFFRRATASNNTLDGFAIQNIAGAGRPASVTFLGSTASSNWGDGFDLNADLMEVICSSARDNRRPTPSGTPTPADKSNGIITFNARPVLHVENCHIRDNQGVGIVSDAATVRIISSTLADNEFTPVSGTPTPPRQIRANRPTPGQVQLYVYNTLARGAVFVDGNAIRHCGHNLYTGSSGGCTGMLATPIFESTTAKDYLASNSPGVDSIAVNPNTIAELTGLVQYAVSQDRNGGLRPRDGNVPPDGMADYDVGAFERAPATSTRTPTRTPTRTWTGTPTRTPTRTATATRTFTPRPTRTRRPTSTPVPLPCVTPCALPVTCPGDCNCDNMVDISELFLGINMALGVSPSVCRCFDVNGDGWVAIEELVWAVTRLLGGCSSTGGGGQGSPDVQVTVGVGTACGGPGAAVTVPISVSGGEGFVAGAQVDILFEDALFFVNDPATDCTLASRLSGTHEHRAAFADAVPAPAGMSRLRVLVLPAGGTITPFTDGEVARCTFHIDEAAAPGTYTLQADRAASGDAAGNGFNTNGGSGNVTVAGGCGCG